VGWLPVELKLWLQGRRPLNKPRLFNATTLAPQQQELAPHTPFREV